MKSTVRIACGLLAAAMLMSAHAENEMEIVVDATVEPTPRIYRELINGLEDTDNDTLIRTVQQQLYSLGYLSKEPDGVFDDATEDAVLWFQLLNGLPDTGIADVDTQKRLDSDPGALIPAPTPEPTPRLSGARGDDVTLAQTMLAQWGFLDGDVDGKYGPGTEEAVKAYKTYVYFSEKAYAAAHPKGTPVPTPTPDPTPYVAEGEQPIVVDRTADPTPTPSPTSEPYDPEPGIDDALMDVFRSESFQVYAGDVTVGSHGRDVTRVQTRLGQLGYLYAGADGDFGAQTERALKFFQRRNGLSETGVADEITQRILFSGKAVESTEYVFPYKLVVDVSDQKVYVYEWNGEKYGDCVKTMICSTGTKSNPTPLGTYQAGGKCGGEWYYFKDYSCYAKYAFRIYRGILFHSVIYNSRNDNSLVRSTVNALGSRASHGCVRLSVDNAKWICDNCPNGITVVVQN